MRPILLLLCVACASPGSRPGGGNHEVPDIVTTAPSIRGTITRKADKRILIEEEPLDSLGSAKANVRLTASTRVLRGSGDAARQSDLRVGLQVSVWFVGPVMESYPVQSTAGAVRIESEDGEANQMEITGVIRYYELEGGFYGIQSEEGETYNPINLPAGFRQDGLPIVTRIRLRNEMMSIHQAGPLVEIIEIRKR